VFVDFNMTEPDGRYPSLAGGFVGERVVADDGEGTTCPAIIDELVPDKSLVFIRLGGWT
jgi:hypothetical protein